MPSDDPTMLLVGNFPGSLDRWLASEYACDASGGEFSAIPALRRCGLGICVLHDSSLSMRWGAFALLPGAIQTWPRAELYAILTVALRVNASDLLI